MVLPRPLLVSVYIMAHFRFLSPLFSLPFLHPPLSTPHPFLSPRLKPCLSGYPPPPFTNHRNIQCRAGWSTKPKGWMLLGMCLISPTPRPPPRCPCLSLLWINRSLSSTWIPIHRLALAKKFRHNPSELSTLTIFFPRPSSAQLQTVSKIQIALRSLSQVDHKTQAPLIISEIDTFCHHITLNISDPVFRPTFRRPYSSSGRRCRQATPSCFTAMRSRSPPEEGPLPDGGRT